ncbi:hypothetical protein HAX54_024189, partial [Datura stramonium]|nr:hypothetical protein [Datura stramonium]
ANVYAPSLLRHPPFDLPALILDSKCVRQKEAWERGFIVLGNPDRFYVGLAGMRTRGLPDVTVYLIIYFRGKMCLTSIPVLHSYVTPHHEAA